MKRFACTVLTLLFLCSLCACSTEQEMTLPKIGICYSQDYLNTAYQEVLPAELEKAGFQVTVVDGKNDHTIQQRQIADFLKQEYDLLIIEPVLIDASGDLVSQLQEADVPGVFINREPGEAALSGWNRVCYIGCDAIQPGILQGRIVLNTPNQGDFNGDGIISYGIISGPGDHVDAQLRTQYCGKELSLGELETSLLATGYGDWTTESGQRVCAQLLSEYGKDLEVLFCNNDAMALGAIQAIADGGRVVGENLCLVGVDALAEAQNMIRNGQLTGTVCPDVQGQLKHTIQSVRALLAGNPVETRYYTNYTAITQESIISETP